MPWPCPLVPGGLRRPPLQGACPPPGSPPQLALPQDRVCSKSEQQQVQALIPDNEARGRAPSSQGLVPESTPRRAGLPALTVRPPAGRSRPRARHPLTPPPDTAAALTLQLHDLHPLSPNILANELQALLFQTLLQDWIHLRTREEEVGRPLGFLCFQRRSG